ncbi:hypothetical protein [Lysinibacillus sp. NPDC093692]|uniref:hypothetical protein n=1 Tax=Lysinibacillus sp. NPDC093692 TaxID=3390578 RepID=UPI003D03B397
MNLIGRPLEALLCAKAKRDSNKCFICAKAKRQQQLSAQPKRKSSPHFAEEV